MTQDALEALARAYDREDASQRGEPDPWDDGKDDAVWVAERLACASAALSALRDGEATEGARPVTIEGLQAAVRVLQLSLQQEREWRAQFDCCMCGSRMDDHDIGSGHGPVSMYDYTLDQLEKRAKAAEDALTRNAEPGVATKDATAVLEAIHAIEARPYGTAVNLGRDVVHLARKAREAFNAFLSAPTV